MPTCAFSHVDLFHNATQLARRPRSRYQAVELPCASSMQTNIWPSTTQRDLKRISCTLECAAPARRLITDRYTLSNNSTRVWMNRARQGGTMHPSASQNTVKRRLECSNSSSLCISRLLERVRFIVPTRSLPHLSNCET
jgi:hypothetical protein